LSISAPHWAQVLVFMAAHSPRAGRRDRLDGKTTAVVPARPRRRTCCLLD
jgi:hypothetical protein